MTSWYFKTFLKSLKVHSVIDPKVLKSDYLPLDLSIDNAVLKAVNVSSSYDLGNFIFNYIKANNAKVAFGGYLEKRGIYQRSTYFNEHRPEEERNIHLGIDIWSAVESPIFAPLAGTIHSFKNNTNHGDYGPTIILKHHIRSQTFYTLYGHLSMESIRNLKIGVEVRQGEQIAALGSAEVNGDYPPHLHFQIIKEIGDFKGDYPGVCNQLNLEFYKENCVDPNLLLGLV